MVAAAVAGAAIVGGYMSSQAQSGAASDAANAQERSAQAGINEQHDEFAKVRDLLSPYTLAGNSALDQQKNLLGMNGAGAQSNVISLLQNSPQFQMLKTQGENSILANASATGGLRGGNVQRSLSQFSPQLLSQLIDQQYGRLGGLTGLGENAAAGVGNAGLSTGNSITDLLQQGGAAQAGSILAGGRANANMYNSFSNALGGYYAQGGFKSGGVSNTNATPAYDGQAMTDF